MRVHKLVAFLPSLFVLSACSVFSVHQSPADDPPHFYEKWLGLDSERGIPFYVRVGTKIQKTTFARTYLEIGFLLEKVDSGKTIYKSEGLLKVKADLPSDAFNAGVLGANEAVKSTEDLNTIIDAFKSKGSSKGLTVIELRQIYSEQDPCYTGSFVALIQTPLSNAVEQGTKIDYSNIHYYNAKAPIFGSADASFELAPDGTLAKGTVHIVEPKPAELVPLTEIASKAISLAKTGTIAPSVAEVTPERRLTISLTKRGYLYTLTSETLVIPKPLSCASENVAYEVTEIGSETKKEKPPENAIKFDGSIVLPKK